MDECDVTELSVEEIIEGRKQGRKEEEGMKQGRKKEGRKKKE